MVAPSRIAIQGTVQTSRTLHLETHRENAVNVVGIERQPGVKKGQLTYTIAMLCWKGIGLGVQAWEQFIK